ncbi:hypothetical protein U8607_02180 [Methylobacterium durans]|uniref:helix-turn-helix domain-containing protein n=1 Tax=Methylobacterium durans TaxID=2202825 RepID=UPI002AFF9E99|nr:hypothetical protein [Methylobacterium durans]MEA1830880.1 hypothetical protein [Methylobacterium durans]
MPARARDPSDLLRRLGRNVRRLRLSLGLSIDDLAFLSELDPERLLAVEGGDGAGLDLAALVRLAWALGVGAEDLIGRHSDAS